MPEFVTVEGLALLTNRLRELGRKIETQVMRDALRDGCEVVRAEARAQCPARTGALRGSITVRDGKDAEVSAYVTAGAPRAGWYARFVEFGTAGHWIEPKVRGFLDRGKRRVRQTIVETTLQELKSSDGRSGGYAPVEKKRKVWAEVDRGAFPGFLALGKGEFVSRKVWHRGTAPRPFMRPAFDSAHERALEAIARRIRRFLPAVVEQRFVAEDLGWIG